MRTYVKFLVVSIFFVAFAGKSFAKDLKIGSVNLETVFQKYYKTDENKKTYDQEREKQQKEITNLQDKLKELQADYERQKDLLKPEQKQKKEDELKKKSDELITLAQTADQTLNDEKTKIINKTLQEISGAIKDFAQKNKYDLILDSSAVLYAPEGTDLTETIITIINQGAPKSE